MNALGLTNYGKLTDVKATSANISAAAWQSIQLLYAGVITILFPANPADGDYLELKIMNGLATNIVNPNGKSINGVAVNMTLNAVAGRVGFQYSTTTGDWRIL